MTDNYSDTPPQQVVSKEKANPTNEHQPFKERLAVALKDDNMQSALTRFAPSWRASRQDIFASSQADYGSDFSFAHMRSALRNAKDYAIEHQPELIAQFKAQAEAAGAFIYEARTAEDANRYIFELCQRKGIDLVVKSKTMASEEIELNSFLETRGIKAVETDLGEWVAQLSHERPSHMVMPIIHKTRQQVGAILSASLGREISREDVAEQVAVVRVEHHKSFLNAGMGINRVKDQLSLAAHGTPGNASTEHAEITVCYFAGCMIDRLYPKMGETAIHVLKAAGVRVTFPQKQSCRGLIALNSGDRRDCVTMAYQTITMLEEALAESKADYIVGATTSCVVTLTQDYIRLFENLQQQEWLQRARTLAGKVMDFASFVVHILLANGRELPVRKGDDIIVTYHDSCQSVNCLGLRSEARHIIQEVLGLELREMPQSDVCCGFGGATSIEHGDISERMMNNKLNNAESTGATVLVSDNPGCLMHLSGGVDASRRRIRVFHLAQLIADQLE